MKIRYRAVRPEFSLCEMQDDLVYANEHRGMTIWEFEPRWRDTGLVDSQGTPIRAYEQNETIGFLRDYLEKRKS